MPPSPPLEKLLAFSVDCNGRFVELDPFVGAAMAVAEACRNLVCTGAEPLGLTDCLNFGNPERPEVMRQFSRAIDGIAAACDALAVPIVSGNVSLYNETDRRAILPTPTIGAVGLVEAIDAVVTPWWKEAGDEIFLLGTLPAATAPGAGLAGSEYAAQKLGSRDGAPAWPLRCPPVSIDLARETRLQKLVLDLARSRKLRSAHDISDGGLAVALAECTATAPDSVAALGARIDVDLAPDVSPNSAGLAVASAMFGEHPSRVLVSVRPDDVDHLSAAAEKAGVAALPLGVTGGSTLSIQVRRPHAVDASGATNGTIASMVASAVELRAAREGAFTTVVGA
jgi:phosphoribosylformylglycinamidine synthase